MTSYPLFVVSFAPQVMKGCVLAFCVDRELLGQKDRCPEEAACRVCRQSARTPQARGGALPEGCSRGTRKLRIILTFGNALFPRQNALVICAVRETSKTWNLCAVLGLDFVKDFHTCEHRLDGSVFVCFRCSQVGISRDSQKSLKVENIRRSCGAMIVLPVEELLN